MTREEHAAKIDEIIRENREIRAIISRQNDKLNKLSNMRDDTEEAYQRGLNDAWECARKIADGVLWSELLEKTGHACASEVLDAYSAQEAIAKMAEYEKQKDAIKIGDEVIAYPGISKSPFVVIKVNEEAIYGIDASGLYRGCARSEADFVKTGRSFPQIAEAMKAMQGEVT